MRELREQKDVSLRELAKKLEVSPAFLSDIELGRRYPSDEVLVRIARELSTSVESLKAYDTRPPVEELKRMAAANPLLGAALRRVVDKKVSTSDLIDFLNKEGKKK